MTKQDDSSVLGFNVDTVFRSLFAAYPDALLLVDLNGVIGLANPAAADLLGYAACELIGLSVDALVPDATRPRHAAYRHAYAESPRARPMGTQMELVARRRDGSQVMVEIALSPLNDNGLPFVVAAIRGVGAYPRVQQALQRAHYAESLARFGRLAADARDPRELLEQVPTVATEALQVDAARVLLLEPNGLEWRVAAGVGLPQEESIDLRIPNTIDSSCGHAVAQGKPVLVTEYAQERRFTVPAYYLSTGFVCELTVPLSDRGRTSGLLSVYARARKAFGDDEIRYLDSLSSLLATILQRTKSEEALNHSQRMESVGQLTGGIAHDFNNLLTVISGNLQALEEAPGHVEDSLSQQLIGAATRATRRGAELTSKLLAFSRRQVLKPAMVDIGALLESLTDMLRRTVDQRIAITLETVDALCLADPVQLESALLNIAINARDAMPQGGTLSFACRVESILPLEPDMERGRPAADGYVAISVGDTGAGMSEAVKEHAFEPFFTTKEAGRGTGLGLSTVYGFAKQSHGAVNLSSVLGVGTTVTLYLPRVKEDESGDGDLEATVATIPAGLRVLLVEDDAEVSVVVHRFLASMGCEVVSCIDAEAALDRLAVDHGLGFLLTDVALGVGMRGTDLADEVRVRYPRLPVLLMSGFSSELFDEPREWEVLRKPYTRSELESAIARTLSVFH